MKNIKILFHFEDNKIDTYSGRQDDIDAWRYAHKAFGLSEMHMIDKTTGGVEWKTNDAECPLYIYKSIDEWKEKNRPTNIYYLETEWSLPKDKIQYLNYFVWKWVDPNEDNWFLIGDSEGFNGSEHGNFISIKQDGKGAMHSVHIIGILLHHLYNNQG